MASIFTFDPDPPKVSSPWIGPNDPTRSTSRTPSISNASMQEPELLSNYGVTKLQAEPQDGPTEYKLHLLLRLRRTYSFMSTTGHVNIPKSTKPQDVITNTTVTPGTVSNNQTRQQRLQHLTTQLLWRLQQSSPYHSASAKQLTMPILPGDSIDPITTPMKPAPLVPGLEESGGALYEIGVADDGTLVGLAKDEMIESLATLRIMAASLGCSVEVMRMVIVGDCEWIETQELIDGPEQSLAPTTRKGKLWVAEALVTPCYAVNGEDGGLPEEIASNADGTTTVNPTIPSRGSSTTSQLRITLTGPTTSGKSSLLGTLSTGTLDNGRGKSRLSLLKHRHEMMSGVTSSIAQELIGYKDGNILNFAHGGIESWTDIHDRAEEGRLVFVSDSGGHPRYRRTVLRGLMNWAPHWSILCIAADDSEQSIKSYNLTTPSSSSEATSAPAVDLVKAHLTLSLNLDVPMAVVITKMDVASKGSLQKTMIKVLSAIKDAGRVPKILQPDQKGQRNLSEIPNEERAKIQPIIKAINDAANLTTYVPIVLTSAMTGSGIGLLHSLLESLPMPPSPTASDYVGMALNPEQPKCLFHIDDTFHFPISSYAAANMANAGDGHGVIVSGHLRFGNLSIGDKLLVGPFPAEDEDGQELAPEDHASSPGAFGLSISHPASAELAKIALRNAVSASEIRGEWLHAHIVSIRNLKLPVRTLEAGQAGSIGLIFEQKRSNASATASHRDIPRIRRGMILAVPSRHMLNTGLSLQAASGFTSSFKSDLPQSLVVGSLVNVYVASVRAAARVSRVSQLQIGEPGNTATDDIAVFSLMEDVNTTTMSRSETACTEVSLDLLHHREWIEMGSTIILLEGGTQDRSGLEGFVGKVTEIVD